MSAAPVSTRILIVDDSATHRLWLEMMLAGRYEVHVASDGGEAVERALALRPALILLDVVMPRVDGLEACRRLRQHREMRGTPIILVTTKAQEWDVESGFASGCTDYVIKPVDELELLTKVESWLAGHRPHSEGA